MAPRAKIVGRTVRARQVDPAHPAPRTRCERIIITPIPGVASAFPFRKGQHLKAAARRKPALALRQQAIEQAVVPVLGQIDDAGARIDRSEEHTSELQSLMRISYAVFCLKKKKQQKLNNKTLTRA